MSLHDAEAWIADQPKEEIISGDDLYPEETRIRIHYGVQAMSVQEYDER